MKSIILCADDYGQNSAISQAIIELIKRRRISATSCLTASANWPEHAKWLKIYQNQVDVGLHFDLTECVDARYSLSRLIVASSLRLVSKAFIRAQLNAQIDSFLKEMGRLPDYIDGHLHVHQFPVVRDVLFEVYEKRLRAAGCYIRCVTVPGVHGDLSESGFLKQLVLSLLGASSFKKQLLQRNIPHNTSFSGFYDFSKRVNYRANFIKFLSRTRDNGLIMCHPGSVSKVTNDAIATTRPIELAYFLSDQFLKDCAAYAVQIARFHK